LQSSPEYRDALPEDRLRSGTYTLLASLLSAPPDTTLLARLQSIEPAPAPQDTLAQAWIQLARSAAKAAVDPLNDEFHALFIGIGRGELVPYGSWYKTGFLMERPLGDLRRDLAALGYQRSETVREPEDHAAALCEVMALLILDQRVSPYSQRNFFQTHVGSWMAAFFKDLEQARNALFYQAVGRLGYEFIQLEQRYLAMEA
jgi:TorA maturation chaperone TorD